MEASREQISPKGKLSRPPGFTESPKEDKENEKEKRDGFSKEDSGTESGSEDSSEEDSEEDSEEEDEEPPKPTVNSVAPRSNVTVNSVSSKPAVNSLKKPEDESDSEEETGSETEESSEEEEEAEKEPVKPDTRTSTTSSSRTPVTTRAQSTPFSTSKPGVGGASKLLKSPFLDNDKKANAPSSPVSKTEPSRISRLAGKEETKADTKSRFGSYPTRTTADSTSNATSTTTTSTRDRISSTPSEDTRSKRANMVTKRAATSYVGGGGGGKGDGDEDEEEEEDGKSNDISHKKTSGEDERKVRE